MNKSTQTKRAQRSDKGQKRGKPKRSISPEYASYLTRKAYSPRRLQETELLALLAQGCSLCGEPGERLYRGAPYCSVCDTRMHTAIGEAELLSWVRKVAKWRLAE